MEKILMLYFSGTGNTLFAVKRLKDNFLAFNIICHLESIEGFNNFEAILKADTILIAFPIYNSDMPLIMKKFLTANKAYFKNKRLITLVTQQSFSGDGGNLVKGRLKKERVKIISSIHVNMPSNISDFALFKIRKKAEYGKKISKAKRKIDKCFNKIIIGKTVKNGRHFYSWTLGFFGQRMFYRLFIERRLKSSLKIDEDLCSKCRLCVASCPMKNIVIGEKIETSNNCTACYRCINLCPKKAISLLSKRKPKVQYQGFKD